MTQHHTTRRAILAGAAALPAVSLPALAEARDRDAKILALEAEIQRLYDVAEQINRERVDPTNEEFERLAKSHSKAGREAFLRFGKQSGRDHAIDDANEFIDQAVKLVKAMWATPAATNVGRAAKVRVFLSHEASNDLFRGPDADLNWDVSLCRRLLGEFSGMSEADLCRAAAVKDHPDTEANHARA